MRPKSITRIKIEHACITRKLFFILLVSVMYKQIIFWVLLNRTPSSTQLHPPPPSSFQPPPSYLQHPQRYKNQNIARNWEISQNLDRKIQSCPSYLEIDTHGILEVLIPNPDLEFRNSDPKMPFWANLGRKSQSCPFCLKISTQGISRMLIFILILVF